MAINERIRKLRLQKQMTLKDVADEVGVGASTVRKWETGMIANIGQTNLAKLAVVLGTTPEALMEWKQWDEWDKDKEMVKGISEGAELLDRISAEFGKQAINLLQAFDELNNLGKDKAVESVEMIAEIPRFQKNPTIPMRSIPVYDSPAAAGSPLFAESEYEYIDFPVSQIPKDTDFGVRISGESMHPTIEDDSIVFVEKTAELQNGEIGVFMLNDSAVCKRLKLDDQGRVMALESDNPEYGSIKGQDLDGFRVVGRVLL